LNENNLPSNVLGKQLNRGTEGVLGMASAIVFLFSLFKFKKA